MELLFAGQKKAMKTKKCKNCGHPFEPKNPFQPVCFKCAYEWTLKLKEKKQRREEKENKLKLKSMKQSVLTLSQKKQLLQPIVNKIARLIDWGCPCVSSKRIPGDKRMNGGHRFAVGGWDYLRFNLFNIWIQSFEQNHFKSGNPTGFDDFLQANGLYEFVHDLRLIHKDVKFNSDLLDRAIQEAKSIIKILEVENKKLTQCRGIEERIELRKKFNIQLGIYE